MKAKIKKLCLLLKIDTKEELNQFKKVSGAKTDYELFCELEKVAMEANNK